MIFFRRRRLIAWLIKAYIKRWGKTILLFFGAGLIIFSLLFLNRHWLIAKIPFTQNTNVGLVGSYTADTLPQSILDQLSQGLTKVSEDGAINSGAASGWEIKDNGKTYVFHLKKGMRFTDGKELNSSLVKYNFADVITERPDKWTIVYKLKESYSPFLLTVSNRKIFKDNLVGIGPYKVTDIKLNAGYVQSLETSDPTSHKKISYKFFDTQDTLKTAFLLGEIDEITEVNDLNIKKMSLDTFNNVKIEKNVNYSKLVTLFYDNQHKTLSNKKIRKALSYALPNDFIEGESNFSPYSPRLWANAPLEDPYVQDYEHSQLLLKEEASTSGKLDFTIKTLPQYRMLADKIADSWKQVGVKTLIETVDSVPSTFEIFLGEFEVLRDPDQYTLWHSGQQSNISNYRSLRIDKLLEDGRKTVSQEERKKIYSDFEKYLLDDSPASFLYFPYTYKVTRK